MYLVFAEHLTRVSCFILSSWILKISLFSPISLKFEILKNYLLLGVEFVNNWTLRSFHDLISFRRHQQQIWIGERFNFHRQGCQISLIISIFVSFQLFVVGLFVCMKPSHMNVWFQFIS